MRKKEKSRKSKRMFQYILLGIALCALTAMAPSRSVKAESANVYFFTEYENATVGDEISVYLYVESEDTLGDFEGFISYNSDILEYKSGASCITGGDGTLKVYDYGTSSNYTRKYMMIFKVIDIGYAQFDMIGNPVAYEYESGESMSVSSMSYGISTVAAASASSNTSLESMKISPGTLTPSFDPNVYVYNSIVDANTTNLVISALPQDFSAKVAVSGNQNLKIGSNEVVITVTAEAGNVQKYIINVVKEEQTENNKEEDEKNKPDLTWRFQAVNDSGKIILSGQYFYTIVTDKAEVTIPEGYEETEFVLDGINIPAYEKKGQTDCLLLILKNEADEIGLYRYDRLEKTIQRYSNENIIVAGPSSEEDQIQELTALVHDYKQNLNQLGIVIALLCGFSGILLIGLIRFYIKAKGMQEDELD